MNNLLHTIFFGAFVVMGLAIIYVKSGQGNQLSGGQQSAMILDSASGGSAKVISALEGNG